MNESNRKLRGIICEESILHKVVEVRNLASFEQLNHLSYSSIIGSEPQDIDMHECVCLAIYCYIYTLYIAIYVCVYIYMYASL